MSGDGDAVRKLDGRQKDVGYLLASAGGTLGAGRTERNGAGVVRQVADGARERGVLFGALLACRLLLLEHFGSRNSGSSFSAISTVASVWSFSDSFLSSIWDFLNELSSFERIIAAVPVALNTQTSSLQT